MLSESGSARLAVHLPSNPPPRASRPGSASARILGQRPHSAGRRIAPSDVNEASKPGYTKYTGELDVWVPCQDDSLAGEVVVDDNPAISVQEITQALSELRAGMASRKDLERLATEIKMEVKTEASALRQKLSAAVHQMAGDTRAARRLSSGLEFAAELGGASADLKSLESSVAGVHRMLQDVISPKLTGFGEMAREVKAVSSTVRELQASSPVLPEELRRLSADLVALLETRTGSCAASWRGSGYTDGLADAEGDANHAAVLAAIRESRTQILREFHDATEQHGAELDRLAAAVRGSNKFAVDVAALPGELQQLQALVRTRVSGAVCEIQEGVVTELKSLASSTASDARELLAAVREGQTGFAAELRQLQSQAELSRQQLLGAVQESRAVARTDFEELRARGAKAFQETRSGQADGPAVAAFERKALEAVTTLGQELKEIHSKAELRSAEVLAAVQESKAARGVGEELAELLVRVEQGSAEVLKAVRESKAERRSPDAEAVQESKAAGEHVSLTRELQQVRSQLELSAGELLAAARELQVQGASAREWKELHTQMEQSSAEILEAVRESKAGDDVKKLHESIQQLRSDLERRPDAHLASAVGELRQQQSKMITDCSAMLQSITDGKMKVDVSPILQAVRTTKAEVDFSEVLQAIHEAKKSVDFSPVLRAIHDHSPDVDLSPVLQAARNSRSSPDVLRGLQELLLAMSELKEGRIQVDWAPVVKEVQRSEAAILSAMAEGRVDFSAVTKKIEESRPKVDFQAEFSQLARSLHRSEVDLLPVLEAINETRTALDASRSLKDVRQLLREIREGNLDLDWAPVMKELRSQCASGTSTVLAALEDVKAGSCAVTKAVEQGNRQVLGAIDERLIEAIREGGAVVGGAVASGAVPQSATQVDLSPALEAVSAAKAAALESSQSACEIKQAVAELRKGQLEADLSPILCEVRQKHNHVEEQLFAVRKAIESNAEARGGKLEVDFSPVVNEVRQQRAQVEEHMLAIRKAVGEGRPEATSGAAGAEVDLAPVLRAIDEVKFAVAGERLDLSPVLRAIEDVKSFLEGLRRTGDASEEIGRAVAEFKDRSVPMILKAVETSRGEVLMEVTKCRSGLELQQMREAMASVLEGKLGVDLSPVLQAIERSRGETLMEVRQGQLEIDFSPVLNDVQLKHSQVEAKLSAVCKAIEDGKCREDSCLPGAAKTSRVEMDLSPVLDAIRDSKVKPDLDFSPVLGEVQRQHKQVEEHFSVLRQAISDIKDRLGEAIPGTAASSPNLAREGKPEADLTHIVSEVQQVHAQVAAQLSAVRQAMEQGQLDTGSSAQVLKAVEASVAEVVGAVGTVTTALSLGSGKPEAAMMRAMDSKLDSLLSKLDSLLREPRPRSLAREPSPRRVPTWGQLGAASAPAPPAPSPTSGS